MKRFSLFLFVFLSAALCLQAQELEIPVVDSVSVDSETQNVVIGWHLNYPDSVDGYIIKRRIYGQPGVVDGSFNTIAEIDDSSQMSYEDTSTTYGTAQPGTRSEAYRVASFKNAEGDILYSNMSSIHQTLFLAQAEFEPCAMENFLHWSPYQGWETDRYELFVKPGDSAEFELLASLSATDTSYTHSGLSPNINYTYFLRATATGDTASTSSNPVERFSFQPEPPAYINADFASTATGKIKLSFSFDEGSIIENYRIVRRDTAGTPFKELVTFSSPASPVEYTDTAANPAQAYCYKLQALDNCENIVRQSNLACNIALAAYQSSESSGENIVQWNAYRDWLGNVNSYELYRSIDESDFEQIAILNDTSYTDEVGQIIEDNTENPEFEGKFCYRVEARENVSNPHGVVGFSVSNVACTGLAPRVFVPNAFNPHSTVEANRSFRPYVSFANDYNFQIFTRWGTLIFETQDTDQGWDGKINGTDPAKEGVYVYHISFATPEGETFSKTGTVLLFYP